MKTTRDLLRAEYIAAMDKVHAMEDASKFTIAAYEAAHADMMAKFKAVLDYENEYPEMVTPKRKNKHNNRKEMQS